MTFFVEFEIQGLPTMPNGLLGAHWRTRSSHATKWLNLLRATFVNLPKPVEPLKRARLTLVRFSSVEPDHDGLAGSFKSIIDALVKLNVLENDKISNIGRPEYQWKKTPPKWGRIRVTVEEVPDGQTI